MKRRGESKDRPGSKAQLTLATRAMADNMSTALWGAPRARILPPAVEDTAQRWRVVDRDSGGRMITREYRGQRPWWRSDAI